MGYKGKTNKEYQREYYLKNRDGNAEKHRKYYEMNKFSTSPSNLLAPYLFHQKHHKYLIVSSRLS